MNASSGAGKRRRRRRAEASRPAPAPPPSPTPAGLRPRPQQCSAERTARWALHRRARERDRLHLADESRVGVGARGHDIAVGGFRQPGPLAIVPDQFENLTEVAEVAPELDVVLAGAKDPVVAALDQYLSGARGARLQVARRDREVSNPPVETGEAARFYLLERRTRMRCLDNRRTRPGWPRPDRAGWRRPRRRACTCSPRGTGTSRHRGSYWRRR